MDVSVSSVKAITFLSKHPEIVTFLIPIAYKTPRFRKYGYITARKNTIVNQFGLSMDLVRTTVLERYGPIGTSTIVDRNNSTGDILEHYISNYVDNELLPYGLYPESYSISYMELQSDIADKLESNTLFLNKTLITPFGVFCPDIGRYPKYNQDMDLLLDQNTLLQELKYKRTPYLNKTIPEGIGIKYYLATVFAMPDKTMREISKVGIGNPADIEVDLSIEFLQPPHIHPINNTDPSPNINALLNIVVHDPQRLSFEGLNYLNNEILFSEVYMEYFANNKIDGSFRYTKNSIRYVEVPDGDGILNASTFVRSYKTSVLEEGFDKKYRKRQREALASMIKKPI